MRKVFFGLLVFTIVMVIASCVTTGSIDWDMIFKRELPPDVVSVNAGISWLEGALAVGSFAQNMWRDLWGMHRADQQQNYLSFREDNAIQRRAADLQAAGLSKTLAAGSAANSGVVSLPEIKGGAFQDALSAAASVQGIKNAKTENAVMESQKLRNFADVALAARQGNKADAEANYMNAAANEMMIKGQVDGALMLNYLQQIEESKQRSQGYRYKANLDYADTLRSYWQAANEYLDNNLIQATGQRSTSGGNLGAIFKLANNGLLNGLMRVFNQEPIHSDVSGYVNGFDWK